MKVIIIGGDVSALVCAITCRRDNLNVIVLESGQDTETPPGVQIPPNGTHLLRRLGLLDEVLEKGNILQTIDFRHYADGGLIRSMPCGEETCRVYRGPWITIHRADLLQILRDRARKLGTEIRSAAVREVNSATAEVILEDWEKLQGDIVIKANDKTINEPPSSSTPNDTETIYQATISRKHLEALNNPTIDELWQDRHSTTVWLGPNQHAVFYPVRHSQTFILNIYHTNTDSNSSTTPTAQEICTGWDTRLQTILTLTPTLTPTTTSSNHTHNHHHQTPTQNTPPQSLLTHLPTQITQTIPPYLFQTTSTAIEDALTLGTLLSLYNQHTHLHFHPQLEPQSQSHSHLPSLLTLHTTLRAPITTSKTQAALSTLRTIQLENGLTQQARDWVLSGAGITRDTDGWWKVVSSRQEGVLGGGVGLVDETGRAFWEWMRERGGGLGDREREGSSSSSWRSSCGIGGSRRRWYAWC
ncbi:salicylate hydroxylase [Aspergillus eucalypticola CBS 122712]|uniref:Salicylate hydroxylase n=1 Tax=Aspergillus eucalypticola (strain CBS 122712 / IBT 29274) TaxID=1448314 RepID=A0A317UY33_ASPEC|nr:salicylate hydroxylase [Aspergillus eucalypticola CBS 122712]PWY66249.1 salicylate hydroxylase [Aspergillus eucalypticola CBS 122712]